MNVQIPGYHFDGRRYYKIAPNASSPASAPAAAAARPSNHLHNDDGSKRQKRLAVPVPDRKGKGKAIDSFQEELAFPSICDCLRLAKRSLSIKSHALSHLALSETVYPDCLPVDESLTCLALDDQDPTRLFLGGVNGTIAEYNLDSKEARLSWMLPNQVTSIRTYRGLRVCTSFGPTAQAVVSATTESISLGSIILSPRKTSLWTSAISDRFVALGCDRSVLVSPISSGSNRQADNSQMRSITTGGKGGGGAVFALELYQDTVVAGTRKGQIKLFDTRDQPQPGSRSQSQIASIDLSSSVTNLRLVPRSPNYVVAAAIDGSLALYDFRFVRSQSRTASGTRSVAVPVQSYEGHDNSYMRDLGFDVSHDHIVAADQRGGVRIWELTSGKLVDTLQQRTEGQPVRALALAGEGQELWVAAGPALERHVITPHWS